MSELMTAVEVAARIHPDLTERAVKRKWATGRWPFTKVGSIRGMTEQQLAEALAMEAVAATYLPPQPSPSGLSPRSRHRRVS